METPQPVPRAAFVRALRCGDVATMGDYFKQPHVQAAAARAESWLAAQTLDVVRRAWFHDPQSALLAERLARAMYGAAFQPRPVQNDFGARSRMSDGCYPWFVASDGSLELAAFASRDSAVESAQWLLSSPLVQSTPLTVQWVLAVLAHYGGRTANIQLLEVLFESAVFRELCYESDRMALLDHCTLAWVRACSWPSGKQHYGHVDVARVLLAHGTSLETLQRAIIVQNASIDQFLLDNGARLQEMFGYFPSWLCVRHEYLHAMVESGADPRTIDHRDSWHVVLSSGTIQAVRRLLDDWCVDVDARDRQGRTPLMHAVVANFTYATRRLLDMGADMAAVDGRGRTSLAIAAALALPEVVEILLARGANPNHADESGNTPLQVAKRQWTPDAQRVVEILERYSAQR